MIGESLAELGVDAGSSRIVRIVTSPDEELRTLPTPTEDLASKGAREMQDKRLL